MNIINILILIFVVMTLLVGSQMYQSDLEYDTIRDIENLTSEITWDFNYTLIEPSNLLSNLLVMGIIFWIGFMVYSKMDKQQVHNTIERIKGWIGNKEE